ncbi:hypothetical protein LCGC14_0297810 [marine sediment metagenome]|uniref:Uncharacterized protein n=1 Tax=marine sediment metagenome TaxID=412755 RepID=A0A0F9U858_9ZZZZ
MTPNDIPDVAMPSCDSIPEWAMEAARLIVEDLLAGNPDKDYVLTVLIRRYARIIASHAPQINERLLEGCKLGLGLTESLVWNFNETIRVINNLFPFDKEPVGLISEPPLDSLRAAIAEADSHIPHYDKLVKIARLVVEGCEEGTIISALDAVDAAYQLAVPILEDIDKSAEAGTAKEEEKK